MFNYSIAPLEREATEMFLGMCRKLIEACFDERERLEPKVWPYLPVAASDRESMRAGGDPYGRRGVLLGGALGILLGIAALVAPALAEERPAETRVDLFDTKSHRTGAAVIDRTGERVDFYDTQSRRTGYGTISPSGRLDLFDTRGNRTGYGTIGPGGTRSNGGRR